MPGGELGNSSASSREYMAERWSMLDAMQLHTVVAPIDGELVEPEEGALDFSSLDWLVEDVRAHDMRLVLLWFGTWKNSMSSYVPAWVKSDAERFPRTTDAQGRAQEIISAFFEEARDADARACAALVRHLKQVDGDGRTVIMVQVINGPFEIAFHPARFIANTIDASILRGARNPTSQWRANRRLNGDQTHQGRHVRLPPEEFGIQRLRLYRY